MGASVYVVLLRARLSEIHVMLVRGIKSRLGQKFCLPKCALSTRSRKINIKYQFMYFTTCLLKNDINSLVPLDPKLTWKVHSKFCGVFQARVRTLFTAQVKSVNLSSQVVCASRIISEDPWYMKFSLMPIFK